MLKKIIFILVILLFVFFSGTVGVHESGGKSGVTFPAKSIPR